MWRSTVKIAAAIFLVLLLAVPVTFYEGGRSSAVRETAWLVLIFILGGWVPQFSLVAMNSPPKSLDARIVTGMAFALVYVLSGEVQKHLSFPFGSMLGGLQIPLLIGLLGQQSSSWWFRTHVY